MRQRIADPMVTVPFPRRKAAWRNSRSRARPRSRISPSAIETIAIFLNVENCLRLMRALAVEMHESWLEATRYLNMDHLKEHKKRPCGPWPPDGVDGSALHGGSTPPTPKII